MDSAQWMTREELLGGLGDDDEAPPPSAAAAGGASLAAWRPKAVDVAEVVRWMQSKGELGGDGGAGAR